MDNSVRVEATQSILYVTNRRHVGSADRPARYDHTPSASGIHNLRFGSVELTFTDEQTRFVRNQLQTSVDGYRGDGTAIQSLLKHILRQASSSLSNPVQQVQQPTVVIQPFPESTDGSTRGSNEMFARFADESTQQSDVLVYIHGYNTSWEEAVADAMALQLLLNNDVKKKVVVVLFTWPSDGIILPWISYFSDRSDASHCRFALLRSLLLIRDRMARLRQCEEGRKQNVAETPASGDTPSDLLRRSLLCSRKIHLLCHSMGNHVLEQALAESIANPAFAVSDRLFDHVFMFAPDVDTDATEHGKPLSQLSNLCQNATVYYNKQDVALGVSAFTKHARERLGRTGPARPALTDRTFMYVDCSWAVTKGLIEHGYHLGGMALRDMSDSIQGVRQSKRAYREGDPVFPNLWLLKRIPWYKKWM